MAQRPPLETQIQGRVVHCVKDSRRWGVKLEETAENILWVYLGIVEGFRTTDYILRKKAGK